MALDTHRRGWRPEVELVGAPELRRALDSGTEAVLWGMSFCGTVSTSRNKSLRQEPCIDVYLTKKRNLVVYTDWRESNEELGATYHRYRNFEALQQTAFALKPLWQDDLSSDPVERLDLEQEMLEEVADAVGETLVIRID